MRRGLESAICLMLTDALDKPLSPLRSPCNLDQFNNTHDKDKIAQLPLIFAAKSLGSRYLLDTLLPTDQIDTLMVTTDTDDTHITAEAESSVKKAIAASLSKVYLMANQLPLLGLGAIRADTLENIALRDKKYCNYIAPKNVQSECNSSPLGKEFDSKILSYSSIFDFAHNSRIELGLGERKIVVYAYHDPADLLGYKAGRHFTNEATSNVDFIEIVHRNAIQWLSLFADPKAAHAEEDTSKQASQIIWCGAIVEDNGKLVPLECK